MELAGHAPARRGRCRPGRLPVGSAGARVAVDPAEPGTVRGAASVRATARWRQSMQWSEDMHRTTTGRRRAGAWQQYGQ